MESLVILALYGLILLVCTLVLPLFQDTQKQLGHRQGIHALLIKPVQHMSMYKLLLRDLHATASKLGLVTPTLEKAVQITQEIPKRTNDAMTLSMIYGYEHGQIIVQACVCVYMNASCMYVCMCAYLCILYAQYVFNIISIFLSN